MANQSAAKNAASYDEMGGGGASKSMKAQETGAAVPRRRFAAGAGVKGAAADGGSLSARAMTGSGRYRARESLADGDRRCDR